MALLVAVTAGPAFGDPTKPTDASTACWNAGTTPGLFAWRASPGIACRDNAAATPTPPAASKAGPNLYDVPRARGEPRSHVTFSGSAYFGVAAVF